LKAYKLSRRLHCVAEIVEKEGVIVDVGTDHGYLPYYLFTQNKIKFALLTDINSGPLKNAEKTFQDSSYAKDVVFVQTSGLEGIDNSMLTSVIIAGMGGNLINSILNRAIQKLRSYKQIILQPMSEQEEVRKWLTAHDFKINRDIFVSEGSKFYEIIEIKQSVVDEDARRFFEIHKYCDDLEFGYRIEDHNTVEYQLFLNYKIKKYKHILKSLPENTASDLTINKIKTCKTKIITAKILLSQLEANHDYISRQNYEIDK